MSSAASPVILLCVLILAIGCSSPTAEQTTFFESGKVHEKYQILKINQDTVRHGNYLRYDENGKVAEECTYVHGKINGVRKLYTDGLLVSTETRLNDQYHGPFIANHPNGKVQLEANYTQDEMSGIVKVYYLSGVLKEIVNFDKNVESGPFKEFYENGNVKAEGEYKQQDGPVEHGELKLYDTSGVLIRIMQCDYGKCNTTWKKDTLTQ